MGLDLVPRYRVTSFTLNPAQGKGSLVFGTKPDFTLALKLIPFFKGDPGPQGPPGSGMNFRQHLPETVWVIEHNFGYWPSVQVFDTNGDECEGDLTNETLNRLTITFSAPFAGIARIT